MQAPAVDSGSGNYPDRNRNRLTGDESTVLVDHVQTWRYGTDARQWGFFLAKKIRKSSGENSCGDTTQDHQRPETPGTPGIDLGYSWAVASLSKFEEGFFNSIHERDQFICFADPSTYENHPGWMLRNLLVLVRQRWKLDHAQILCYRETQSRRHEARSIILHVHANQPSGVVVSENLSLTSEFQGLPKITGWERNSAGKTGSKVANLGEYMDPERLARYAYSRRSASLIVK